MIVQAGPSALILVALLFAQVAAAKVDEKPRRGVALVIGNGACERLAK